MAKPNGRKAGHEIITRTVIQIEVGLCETDKTILNIWAHGDEIPTNFKVPEQTTQVWKGNNAVTAALLTAGMLIDLNRAEDGGMLLSMISRARLLSHEFDGDLVVDEKIEDVLTLKITRLED